MLNFVVPFTVDGCFLIYLDDRYGYRLLLDGTYRTFWVSSSVLSVLLKIGVSLLPMDFIIL